MLSSKVSNALNKQVEMEGFSSQYYLSMASWAETQGLNGISTFLYGHSDEERMHMLKLIKFVNERGQAKAQLDCVCFLDGDERVGKASFRTEESFITTVERPGLILFPSSAAK